MGMEKNDNLLDNKLTSYCPVMIGEHMAWIEKRKMYMLHREEEFIAKFQGTFKDLLLALRRRGHDISGIKPIAEYKAPGIKKES